MIAVAFRPTLDTLARRSRQVVVMGAAPSASVVVAVTAALEYWGEALASTRAGHPEVMFVDPPTVLRSWDDFLDERLHLNWRGYVKVGSVILDAVGSRYSVTLG
jgi:hypothetical protein